MTSSATLTDYVVTRWYRAPEVIYSQRQYTAAVDVWSVGCIFAELIRRRPLMPASNEQEQMMMITELIGKPSDALIEQVEDADNRQFMRTLPAKKGKDFNELFRGANDEAIDLLKKMLVFDPEARITIPEALEHPYMSRLHMEEDETTGDPVSNYDFDFELFSLKIPEFKELLFEEIKIYHSEEDREAYEEKKVAHPDGALHLKYDKRRLRTMYKQDPQVLAIFNEQSAGAA